MRNKKIAETAITSSLALILGYVESLIPLPFPVPGIKLGLSNLAVLYALYRLGTKSAFGICFIKVFLSSLLFSGFQTIYFSLAGGFLSLLAMLVLKKSSLFSVYAVSAVGGVCHNIGQLAAAIIILNTTAVLYYLPPLIISGLVTGILIGILCNLILKIVKRPV